MVGAPSIIPARSKAQAQDWSLVLLSQGIESAIEPPGEQSQWEIEVDSAHFGKAVRILRQYLIENRKTPAVEPFGAKLVFDWGNIWFFVLLAVLFVLSLTAAPGLRDFGVMNKDAFLVGEWWRPFTAILLHHDAAHLAANMAIGMVFLGLAGGIFGAGRAFLISFSAGAIANLARCLFSSHPYEALGASGMVMGALGLLTASSVIHRESSSRFHTAMRGTAAGILLLILLGFDPHPQTDVLAHVVGFIAGFLLGAASLLLARRPKLVPAGLS